jgi:antitoxin component YwqK of YwqJK toxin-antitoxin module
VYIGGNGFGYKNITKDKILIEESFYINGINNGDFKLFHSNGNIMSDGKFTNGVITGIVNTYLFDGREEFILKYNSSGTLIDKKMINLNTF